MLIFNPKQEKNRIESGSPKNVSSKFRFLLWFIWMHIMHSSTSQPSTHQRDSHSPIPCLFSFQWRCQSFPPLILSGVYHYKINFLKWGVLRLQALVFLSPMKQHIVCLKSLVAKWLEQASQWHEIYCHHLEVMSSNPGWVELGLRSTSVLSHAWCNNILKGLLDFDHTWNYYNL